MRASARKSACRLRRRDLSSVHLISNLTLRIRTYSRHAYFCQGSPLFSSQYQLRDPNGVVNASGAHTNSQQCSLGHTNTQPSQTSQLRPSIWSTLSAILETSRKLTNLNWDKGWSDMEIQSCDAMPSNLHTALTRSSKTDLTRTPEFQTLVIYLAQ